MQRAKEIIDEYGKLCLMALGHTLLITTLFTLSFFMGLTLTDLILK